MTASQTDTQPINLTLSLSDIGANGHDNKIKLETAQCQQLAKLLDLENINNFECEFKVTPLAKTRFALKTRIKVEFTQASALSAAPLPVTMDENFTTEFWPIKQNDTDHALEIDIDYADEMIEFYEEEALAIGQVIYEQFAVSLDSFLKADGETFTWQGHEAQEKIQQQPQDDSDNPFAILKNLKEK